MIKKRELKINIQTIFLAVLVFCGLLTIYLPSISTPIGELYPYRILLPSYFVFLVFFLKRKLKGRHAQFTILCFLSLVLYGLISAIWAVSPMAVLQSVMNYAMSLLLIATICIVCKNKPKMEKLVVILWVALVFLAFLGIVESSVNRFLVFTGDRPEWNLTFFGTIRPLLFFHNENDYTLLLMLFLPLFIAYASKRGFVARTCAFLTTILFVFVNILTTARTTFILIPLYFYLWLFFTKKIRLFLVLTLIIVIVGAIFAGDIISYLGLGYGNADNNARVAIWLNGLRSFRQTHGFGVGAGNSSIPIPGVEYIGVMSVPHFWFLEVLIEFGVVIFTIIMLWYLVTIYRLVKIKNKDPYRVAFVITMILMPMWSMLPGSIAPTPFVWFFFAMATAYTNILIQQRQVGLFQVFVLANVSTKIVEPNTCIGISKK